jgi:hypothetical protein
MSDPTYVINGKSGEPVASLNVVLCFFGKTEVQLWCDGGVAAIRAWAGQVPDSASAWLALGATASMMQPGGPTALTRCVKQIEGGCTRDRSINAVIVKGPQKYGADCAFRWTYLAKAPDRDNSESNFVEMRFAHDHLVRVGADSFVQWAREVAEIVPFDSGYAALSWSACKESSESEAGRSLGALALRHPGYDVANNRSTHFEIGSRCRGAQWLTFIGKPLLHKAEGIDALRAAVPEGEVHELRSGGLMIRASASPVIGDVNRRQHGPKLAALAQLLESRTYFGDYSLDLLFNDDNELRERWERRFVDA